jgi:CDP-diacylglycerol pyrophosphatase
MKWGSGRAGFYSRLLAAIGIGLSGSVAPQTFARADPSALWNIVHGQCAPHEEGGEGPGPCVSVDLANGEKDGVAILKDLVGQAQMLAIPTRRISGIEDPQMLASDAPNVFADAWKAKKDVEGRLHRALPREDVAIAINSEWRRSQNQFHLHVDCVAKNVTDALARFAPLADDTWRETPVKLNGRAYLIRRLDSADFSDAEPIKLLAAGVDGARADMGDYSLAAVGATFDSKPGFILLADKLSPDGGGHAEDLEDHDCAIAQAAP